MVCNHPDMPNMPSPGSAHVYTAITDMNGIFRGKRIPVSKLEKVQKDGIRMPLSSVGVDIWGVDVAGTKLTLERGDLDGICDQTGRGLLNLGFDSPVLPMWIKTEEGKPYFADGRHLLAEILDRYKQTGLTPVMAAEVEFYLIPSADAGSSPGISPEGSDNIYSIGELSDASRFLDEVYTAAESCDINVEAAIAEGAPRQFEFNLMHQPDALKAAEDTLYFKHIIRNMARRHDCLACFMAKPYRDHAGSSMHVHFSVQDDQGRNVFDNGTADGSARMLAAVGGILDNMADMSLVFAPHLNSYRRLCPGGLAPTTIGWWYENRTAALRIPAGPPAARRIEHRVAGADANPFLVFSAILASALDGITRKLTPPPAIRANSHELALPTLMSDWWQALARFKTAESAGRILHPEFALCFAACKRQEQEVFAARMTDFEISTYQTTV